VDAPFFPDDLVARLAEAAVTPDMISVATSGGRAHPVFGLWPTILAGDLRKFLESGANRSVQGFLKKPRSGRGRLFHVTNRSIL